MIKGIRRAENLLLVPHSDDECLFACYTMITEKPRVLIFDTKITEERKKESFVACRLMGCEAEFWADKMKFFKTEEEYLKTFLPKNVFAPAKEGGHLLHDHVHELGKMFEGTKFYSTYRSGSDLTPKGQEVVATAHMVAMKMFLLELYKSQIIATPCHFEAAKKNPIECFV